MVKENYEAKMQHLEKVVKQWEKRSLTPLGKITVIKTFIISAFNQLFMMLPNPDKNTIDYINRILFSFLWNNKPSKIKQTTIIKQYEDGGLKMLNVMAFMEALKLAWIRRLLTEDCKWQIFIQQYLEIDKLTGCNTKYLEKVISELPNCFWKDVLQSLININKNLFIQMQVQFIIMIKSRLVAHIYISNYGLIKV